MGANPDVQMEFLGTDGKGFRYFLHTDGYVYQQYPVDRDCWRNGHDFRGEPNGWFCSAVAWDRRLHKTLKN